MPGLLGNAPFNKGVVQIDCWNKNQGTLDLVIIHKTT